MKKLIFTVIAITFLGLYSCKKEKTVKKTERKEAEKSIFIVSPDSTTIKWTAYKTTAKKPVSGVFNTVDFNKKEGTTIIETLNNLTFFIPVSSVFSKNKERDDKLKASFFGAMVNPQLLKGTLTFDENKDCIAKIIMNDVSHDLPLLYSVNGLTVTLKGTMNLEDWNALDAIKALNKVCFDLHKGDDGISKTWNDVAVEITTTLQE